MLLVNKELSKAIMAIIFLQNKSEENRSFIQNKETFVALF